MESRKSSSESFSRRMIGSCVAISDKRLAFLIRPSESTSFILKEFGFEQSSTGRSVADRNGRQRRASTVVMDGAGYELFAGP